MLNTPLADFCRDQDGQINLAVNHQWHCEIQCTQQRPNFGYFIPPALRRSCKPRTYIELYTLRAEAIFPAYLLCLLSVGFYSRRDV